MQQLDGRIVYAARDLVGFALCPQLPRLEYAAAQGILERPQFRDPALDRVVERGRQHEARFLEELRAAGHTVVEIQPDGTLQDRAEQLRQAAEATARAMRAGEEVIYQATFFDGRRRGHADFLRRVDGRGSRLGDWAYEVWDTKLAREAKPGALIQVLFYDELLEAVQGTSGERVHLALGGSARDVRSFAVRQYAAWYRRLRRRFDEALHNGAFATPEPAPEPVEHCEVCSWRLHCQGLRRDADHLSLIAGIARSQRRRLKDAGIATRTQFADAPWEDIAGRLPRRSHDAYRKLHRQARLQVEAERTGRLRYELEPLALGDGLPLQGLLALPEPTPNDLFFDIEGDPFALDDGVEYLFGIFDPAEGEGGTYYPFWSIDEDGRVTREAERRAFERAFDFLYRRFCASLREDGTAGMRVYHFGAYEPSTLKRLAARYGTRERELDELLRAETFVDLYRIVRQGLRASVESYSIKQLEPFYGFQRQASLRDAGDSIEAFERWLELGHGGHDHQELRQNIEAYNADDCRSAAALRDWLEGRRRELEEQHGQPLPRPAPKSPDPSEGTAQNLDKTAELFRQLTADLPPTAEEWTDEQRARWTLANLLSWHRRELRAKYWRLFACREKTPEELVSDDDTALGGLEPVTQDSGRRETRWQLRFPPQEHRLGPVEAARDPFTLERFRVLAIDDEKGLVTVSGKSQAPPTALLPFEEYRVDVLENRLRRLAEAVVTHGMSGPGPYRAARELLLRSLPRCGQQPGAPLAAEGEAADAAGRLVASLHESCLAIQGPPGTGKTTLIAKLIVSLAASGKRVGVTANSHAVITNVLERVEETALAAGQQIRIGQRKPDGPKGRWHSLAGQAGIEALNSGQVQVAGGTVWLWANDGIDPVDVLFIDEAGQLSLANALVAAMAAHSVVLVGDPQQLDQPTLAAHPPGTDSSALGHLLGESATIPPDRGLFLDQTWRLHPAICAYTSELFYDGRLHPARGCERQCLEASGFPASGLLFVPVSHEGCDVESQEEVDAVAELCERLTAPGAAWVDRDGVRRPLSSEDILVIAPYNLQVRRLQERLGAEFRVGTVDKFQGQEAPVVIYSMTSSSKEDAPRGMEFLYSLNRLNVATSRAKCLAIVVASPALLDPVCTTIRQMELASALASFVERATTWGQTSGDS